MNLTDAPTYTPTPFANSGTKNVIPIPSQIGITPGAASFTDGFPPVTFEPIDIGGTPPFGADFNGILYDLSLGQRWVQAGGVYGWNSAFSVSISGYPKGAMLLRGDDNGYWLNLADNNTSNPDTGGANWAAVRANIGLTSITVSAGTNIPTADRLASDTLLLTGVIASAATLQLPLTAGASWVIANNTTGAGTLNVQGVSGASVAIAQTTALYVYCDGTGYYPIAAPTTGAYLPLHGTADAAVKLATPRSFIHTGLVTAATVMFDGTANVTFNITSLDVPGALGYTPANDANVVHKTGNESIGGIKTLTSQLNGVNAVFSSTITCTTMNATASDRRLKRKIKRVAPRPLHRSIPFVSYEIKSTGLPGLGAIAQDVKQAEPIYSGEFEDADRKTYLSIDKASLAYEQAVWASQEVDVLAEKLMRLTQAFKAIKTQTRPAGLIRSLWGRIW